MEIQTGASATPGFSPEVERASRAPAAGAVKGAMRSLTALQLLPLTATAIAFAILFARPFQLLVRDWWTMPEAGHGLLLAPVALWLAWRSGIGADSKPARAFGIVFLVLAVLVRCASGLAAELFTMRGSMVLALAGLTVYQFGFRQLIRWWLPFALICLSIPLPELVTQTLALPLQFKASQMGAALLETRNVPVLLTGNVIHLPGRELFVTEACSGLRSLTALLSMAVLLGALVLRTPVARLLLLLLAIPVAIVINGLRVFLTGFLVFFVSPSFGEGFMHLTEGWLLFLVSMSILASVAWVSAAIERLAARRHAAVSQVEVAHA
jgi:exosortase